MLALAAGMVGVALLIVPGATGAFFAWGLGPASLAAFAGGVYVASAVVYAVALRAPGARVARARGGRRRAVRLRAREHARAPRGVRLRPAAGVGVGGAVRGFGVTTCVLAVRGPWWPTPGPRLPLWTRGLLGALASLLGGVAARCGSTRPRSRSPPLGGRFAGSWVAMLATLAAYAALTNRRREARLPALALIALPAGALVAAARTGADPGYLLALALLAAAGAAVLAVSEAPGGAARRARSARTRHLYGCQHPPPLVRRFRRDS